MKKENSLFYTELIEDETKLFKYYRISMNEFNNLLSESTGYRQILFQRIPADKGRAVPSRSVNAAQ